MASSVKGDQGTVRAINRRLILNHVRRAGAMSRSELVERTGLSPAAVSIVTAELIADEFLIERSLGASSGGRPPILLDLNPGARLAIGLKVLEDHLAAVLTDFASAILERAEIPLPNHTPGAVADGAAEAVRVLLERAGRSRERVVGIGLGMPGVVNYASGTCVKSPILGWRDVPIARLITERTGISTFVDNNVNALAGAEGLFGRGKHASSFLTVTIGRGIGAGLVLDGSVYRGREGGAGEFGHMIVEPGGRRCECGRRGCLEAYASEPAILARVREAHPHKPLEDLAALEGMARAGDAEVIAAINDAGRRVGLALANLVTLLNPELIILSGEGIRYGDAFIRPLRDSLSENAFDGLAIDLPVLVSDWGDDAWARGAASLAISSALNLQEGRAA
jgi:predicted NBD/HSP70 family sugar kinase